MRGTKTDLDFFFWPAAQYAAHGHALTVYSFQGGNAYPDANGPVGLVLLMPLAAVAQALGWTDPRVVAAMTAVLAAILALLVSREALGIVRRVRGAIEWRLGTHATFLLAPVLWIAVAGFGHLEQVVETYFLLLAVRWTIESRAGRAGFGLGLALLTRTAASICAIPLAVVTGSRQGRRRIGDLGLVAAATVAAGLAPFLVADGSDVIRSLVTYRGRLPIAGGSVWVLLYRSPLATFAEHADAFVSLGVAAALCLIIVRRRATATADAMGVCGLLCIAACCFPMLAKTVHSYYLFEPYVFGTIWWLARPGTALNWRLAVPALLTADVFLAEWSVTLPLTGLGALEGVLSSVILAAVIALVARDLLRQRTNERSSTQLALTSNRMVTASTPTNTSPTRRGSQVSP